MKIQQVLVAGGVRLVVQRRRHLLVGLALNLNVLIFPLGFVLQSHHLGNFVTDTDPMC